LAWLLDSRIEHGTHAQGSLGFQAFLEELREELDRGSKLHIMDYANERYRVRREVSSIESRVDIEIAAARKFIIHIENKLLAREGKDQTNREWRDLNNRAEQLGVPKTNRHGLLLTLDGSAAENEHFRPIGWDRIARVLSEFARRVRPRYVRMFARHYAEAVRRLAVTSHSIQEIPMAKKLFNEAEMYLLENWTDARLLENSLKAMREKYEEVCERC